MQQNSRCMSCGDINETINHIISDCSKLAQMEYKTRHNSVGKVIYRELCKKWKFDHTNKWYMHNPESVLENDAQTPLGFWDMFVSHLISARGLDLIIINKKVRTCRIVDFALPVYHRVKLKICENRDKYIDLVRELQISGVNERDD